MPTAAEILRASGLRATSQRLLIEQTLRSLDRHVTAEELLAATRERLPGVSLPTIYSTLEVLEDAGLVRRIAAGRGASLYDARLVEHDHLLCRRCGAVTDLDRATQLDDVLAAATATGFAPEAAEIVVHGLCRSCAASRG